MKKFIYLILTLCLFAILALGSCQKKYCFSLRKSDRLFFCISNTKCKKIKANLINHNKNHVISCNAINVSPEESADSIFYETDKRIEYLEEKYKSSVFYSVIVNDTLVYYFNFAGEILNASKTGDD